VLERRHEIVDDVDDRELRAGGPAEPDQDNHQEAVAHQPMRQAMTRQRRLEHEDQRQRGEQNSQNSNVEARFAPGLDPGRDRHRLGLRLRRLEDKRVRDLVVETERDRRGRRAGAMDQKLQPPGLDRIEARPSRERKHTGILLTAKTCRIGVVALHEAERSPVLDDAQPIEAIALGVAKIFGAENIVRPLEAMKMAWLPLGCSRL
jgi:hypothetical protein